MALPDGAGRASALAGVFESCARAEATVRLAAVSDTGVSVVVDEGPAADRAAAGLDARSPARRGGLALLAVVGDGLASGSGVPRRVLAALDATPVHLLSRTPGSNHLACVIDQANLACAVDAVHECLFGPAPQSDSDDDQPDAPAVAFSAYGSAGREVRA